MKKTIVTLIYTSLSLMLLAYLFKLLNWPVVSDFSMGIFWLHIALYIAYSSFVNPKDDRIIYPLVVLVLPMLLADMNICH
jgi:membrane-bound acyltransferase YfiQ involved in biofilm formation